MKDDNGMEVLDKYNREHKLGKYSDYNLLEDFDFWLFLTLIISGLFVAVLIIFKIIF